VTSYWGDARVPQYEVDKMANDYSLVGSMNLTFMHVQEDVDGHHRQESIVLRAGSDIYGSRCGFPARTWLRIDMWIAVRTSRMCALGPESIGCALASGMNLLVM